MSSDPAVALAKGVAAIAGFGLVAITLVVGTYVGMVLATGGKRANAFARVRIHAVPIALVMSAPLVMMAVLSEGKWVALGPLLVYVGVGAQIILLIIEKFSWPSLAALVPFLVFAGLAWLLVQGLGAGV